MIGFANYGTYCFVVIFYEDDASNDLFDDDYTV